jgi:hypothetical protein
MGQSKRIVTACLSVALLIGYTAAQGQDAKPASPPAATASGPSLEETTSWLRDKITYVGGLNYGYTDTIGNERTVLYRYTSTDFNSCRVTIVLETVLDGRLSTTASYSVSLQDLDGTPDGRHSDNPGIPGAAYAFGAGQEFSIKFHTAGNKNLVRYRFLPSGMGSELPYLRLVFADGDMANRVAKALSHAIDVCKAQNPEPF